MAYGCRDVAIILRHPKFKKSQSINTSIMSAKKFSNRYLFLNAQGKTKSNPEVLGLWERPFRLGDVILVFDVIGCLYPNDQE